MSEHERYEDEEEAAIVHINPDAEPESVEQSLRWLVTDRERDGWWARIEAANGQVTTGPFICARPRCHLVLAGVGCIAVAKLPRPVRVELTKTLPKGAAKKSANPHADVLTDARAALPVELVEGLARHHVENLHNGRELRLSAMRLSPQLRAMMGVRA